MRVLLVDDDFSMRRLLRAILEKVGFDVTAATGGLEGLAALAILHETHPPVALLVDWNMPEMTGIEFVRNVRAISKYDSIRIVMCTVNAETEHVDEAIQAGANEYIKKPFTEDSVREKLKLAIPELQ